MFKKIFVFLFVFLMANGFCSKGMAENNNKEEISNRYFSLVMPSDTKNTYLANKEDNTIYILEKVSAKKGIGGFAFGLKIYKNPKDYTDRDDCTKIGELTGKNGEIYDMVLMRPTDIMYADGEEIQKNFDRLYEIGNNLEIKGINGNTYDKNQGTKGEYLYGDILKKYKEALKENWTAIKCKEENLGEIYPSISKKNKKGLKKEGYAYFDINDDGIDELFIGEMTKGDIIYDAYTMVNRKPVHVPLWADIGEKYYVCNERFICEDIHISKKTNTFRVVFFERNSDKLNLHTAYTYDTNLNKNNPWFRYRKSPAGWENISKETYQKEIDFYRPFKKFDFIPLENSK